MVGNSAKVAEDPWEMHRKPFQNWKQSSIKVNKPKPNWEYSVVTDKMDGTKRKFAGSTSTNSMNFKFPYEGTYFKLILRKDDGKKTEIMLRSSGIPFMPSYDYSEKCRVKFDDEQPANYSYNDSKEDMGTVFFSKTQQFMQKLKTANKLMIGFTGSVYFVNDKKNLRQEWRKTLLNLISLRRFGDGKNLNLLA